MQTYKYILFLGVFFSGGSAQAETNYVDPILDGVYSTASQMPRQDYKIFRQSILDLHSICIRVDDTFTGVSNIVTHSQYNLRQKRLGVLSEIDAELEASYNSVGIGAIGLTAKHSLKYGVTRLTWDLGAKKYVDTTYTFPNIFNTSKTYYEVYPDTYIYRSVGGVRTLIKTFQGGFFFNGMDILGKIIHAGFLNLWELCKLVIGI